MTGVAAKLKYVDKVRRQIETAASRIGRNLKCANGRFKVGETNRGI